MRFASLRATCFLVNTPFETLGFVVSTANTTYQTNKEKQRSWPDQVGAFLNSFREYRNNN